MKIEKSVKRSKELTLLASQTKQSFVEDNNISIFDGFGMENIEKRERFFLLFVWYAYLCSEETLRHIYDSNKDEINTSNWFEVLSSFTQLNFDDEYKFYADVYEMIEHKPMKKTFFKANKSIMMDCLRSFKRELCNDEFSWDDFNFFLKKNSFKKFQSFRKKM